MIGYAFCGSFCTIAKSMKILRELAAEGNEIQPIVSENVYTTDTRFGKAADVIAEMESVCGRSVIHSIVEAEPIGPRGYLDVLIIAPCTGNTLAKIACGITDTPVTMAAKAQLRAGKPVVIGLASNDAMAANLANIAKLTVRKNIYFVPYRQDDPMGKNNSLVCDFEKIPETVEFALKGEQIQPVIL